MRTQTRGILMVRQGCVVGIALLVASVSCRAAEQQLDHALWDQVLHQSVTASGLVDYAALKHNPADLMQYLNNLKRVTPSQLPRSAQLAFWINAYNACVIRGVLDHYPMKSVKDVKGFFDKIRYHVGSESLTLNEIEGKGRALHDWRVHFGVVCASSSCPFLRQEAYVPDRLEAQLAEQVRRFLGDPSRGLRFDASHGTLWLSKIFKWYEQDFVPSGHLTAHTLIPLVAPYLEAKTAGAILPRHPALRFLDYDWTLNDQPHH